MSAGTVVAVSAAAAPPPHPSSWNAFATAGMRFIDDSARSSRRPSSSFGIRTPESPMRPSTDDALSNDLLRAVDTALAKQRCPSLTTSTSTVGSPSTTEENKAIVQKSLHSLLESRTATATPSLKSCLVELDSSGKRLTTCVVDGVSPELRQLSFQPSVNGHREDATRGSLRRQVSLSNDEYYYSAKNIDDLRTISPTSANWNTSVAVTHASQLHMERDFRYYFQHPYARLFVVYFVILCNFLIFAEDPVSHSHTESEIPLAGNVFAFVLTKYPPEWGWTLVKVFFWLMAIMAGMIIGKRFIHETLFARVYRLQMFHEEQGSWMVMFLTVMVSLYIFSNVYNAVLVVGYPGSSCQYQITALMGISNSSLMKAAACGTWLGDFITAWMVTDMMLQDNLYPCWAPNIRAFWRTGNTRIVTFWAGSVIMSALVITLIVSDLINWDKLNRDFLATTELSRAFLASFILVMDLLIVMQDWDFPHFTSTLDINLPGMKIKAVRLNFCKCPMNLQRFWKIHITGKWFNYGIIFLVMILDLNMWKNQIFYKPDDYGQYLGPKFKIHTVADQDIIATGNSSLWTYSLRSRLRDPATNRSFREGDMLMNSRYLGYSMTEKCTAFVPSVVGFFMFGLLVCLYGRFPHKENGGRLKRRDNYSQSSWRRERSSLRARRSSSGAGELQQCSKVGAQAVRTIVIAADTDQRSSTTTL